VCEASSFVGSRDDNLGRSCDEFVYWCSELFGDPLAVASEMYGEGDNGKP